MDESPTRAYELSFVVGAPDGQVPLNPQFSSQQPKLAPFRLNGEMGKEISRKMMANNTKYLRADGIFFPNRRMAFLISSHNTHIIRNLQCNGPFYMEFIGQYLPEI